MKKTPPARKPPPPAAEVQKRLMEAAACHTRGDLEGAERGYRAVLARSPEHFDALHLLGAARAQAGQAQEAVELISRAIRISPGVAEAHNNLGYALGALDRTAEAVACYRKAVALKPDYLDAHRNLGNALVTLDRTGEAIECFQKVLALKPGVEAYCNLGNALRSTGRAGEAVDCYRKALALDPGHAKAYNGLGNALFSIHRAGDAMGAYDRALAIDPCYAEAYNNRGNALVALNRNEEALDAYRQALAIKPNFVEAHNHMGNTLRALGRHEQAIASYESTLAIDPGYPYAAGMLVSSCASICEWRGFAERIRRLVDGVKAGHKVAEPLVLASITDDPAVQLACAKMYARDHGPAASPLWRDERYRHERIRVAYLSADFREHPVAWLIAELIERHDREKFETYGISFGPDAPSAARDRLKAGFEHFVDVRVKSDAEIAAFLRESEIDIAVDLMGYTQHCRTGILARRPAPIQANYLGYPGTTGAEYIDYILADAFVIPEDQRKHYSEQVVCLPDSYFVNDTTRKFAERTPTRAEAGLPEQGFVFCSFNNTYKLTPEFFDIWMRLLQRVEHSVLWLVASNAETTVNLRREAQARGVAPERLVFAPRIKQEGYLARYRLADLFLDSLPYNAHSTAVDALWAGVPVLTCPGGTFVARVAGGLLHAVGLPELIAHTLADYEALALKLATQPDWHGEIKSKLAANRQAAPLFDIDRFRRHIESAYRTMWETHQRGEAPRAFSVEPVVTSQ